MRKNLFARRVKQCTMRIDDERRILVVFVTLLSERTGGWYMMRTDDEWSDFDRFCTPVTCMALYSFCSKCSYRYWSLSTNTMHHIECNSRVALSQNRMNSMNGPCCKWVPLLCVTIPDMYCVSNGPTRSIQFRIWLVCGERVIYDGAFDCLDYYFGCR